MREISSIIPNGGNTPGSDEERLEQDDLMDFVPPTPYDSPLLGGHTPGSDEGLNLFKIGTSKRKSLDKENVSKQGRKSDKTKPMFEDSDFAELDMENVEGDAETQGRNTVEHRDTVNTASINVSAARPLNEHKTKNNISSDSWRTRRAIPVPIVQSQDKGKGKLVEPELTLKNPIKTQIQRDAEIAQKLFEEEQAQFEREQRIAKEKAAEQEAKDAALIEQMEDIQARIDADELLAERLQQEERE
ncbi:hypothetical protein Tco_1011093 [Tanacetum coccineum]